MKKVLWLLLLPALAAGEHHRGHTVARLVEVQHFCGKAVNRMDKFAEGKLFTPFEQSHFDNTRKYIVDIVETAQSVMDQLALPEADLIALRRRINQPFLETPLSALKRMHVVNTSVNYFIVTHPEEADYTRGTLIKLNECWTMLDEASWHIVDAILEEHHGVQ